MLGRRIRLLASWIDSESAKFGVEVIDGVLGEGSLELGKGLAQLEEHGTETADFPGRVQIEGVPAVY